MGLKRLYMGYASAIEEHVNDNDFVGMKVDLRNDFNLVSCQSLLDECRAHCSWVLW